MCHIVFDLEGSQGFLFVFASIHKYLLGTYYMPGTVLESH